MKDFVGELILRYPVLAGNRAAVQAVIDDVIDLYRREGTLFLCGNGGSAADADHICGELLKGFLSKRPLPETEKRAFAEAFGEEGAWEAEKLQRGLRAVSLLSHPALVSAFCNDVDPRLIFAQQLYALGRSGDMLIGISTGGGAVNVRFALMAARAKGVQTVLLTGGKHGVCERYADRVIAVPETETYRIQELHLPIYHTICMAVEAAMFGEHA